MGNTQLPNIGNIIDNSFPFDIQWLFNKSISIKTLSSDQFYFIIKLMFFIGIFVFNALFFVSAGYGKFQNSSKLWSYFVLPNKIAWVLMECPVFIIMNEFLLNALFNTNEFNEKRSINYGTLICFALFQIHYFQRSFIFPLLIKGKSKMPIVIMLMGSTFNTCNGILQGNWLFNISDENYYDDLIKKPIFYIGIIVFFTGMIINIHSDHVIRTLRKPGDTKHYLPQHGMYRYVTSANYLGEIIEWTGYAILTQSLSGLLFVFWSIANLVPRAFSIYNLYLKEFGSEVLKKKRIIPYLL